VGEQNRGMLMKPLAKVSKNGNSECSIRIFVTGRPWLNWGKYFGSRSVTPPQIWLEANPDDIRSYVKSKIEADENYDCMNATLEHEIMEKIVDYLTECKLP
jgi:hypothetical protein